ncbi:hypothetical protein T484DRAFT_1836551 [Baffinella frigidus]|nr:hypothetical protein T484DRAFT_1836551 [Cryptophyta sp. CCMP2293]
MSVPAPGIALVAVILLSLVAAPHAGSFHQGIAGGGTAFVGPLSGLLPRAGRGVCASCPLVAGRNQLGPVAVLSVEQAVSTTVQRIFLHRARMGMGRGAGASASGLRVVADSASKVTLDKTAKVKASKSGAAVDRVKRAARRIVLRAHAPAADTPVASTRRSAAVTRRSAAVNATGEAPRRRRGIGSGSMSESIEHKPASRPLDEDGMQDIRKQAAACLKDLLATKKAQAAGAPEIKPRKRAPTKLRGLPPTLRGLPPTLVVDPAESFESSESSEDVLEKEWTEELQEAATKPQGARWRYRLGSVPAEEVRLVPP